MITCAKHLLGTYIKTNILKMSESELIQRLEKRAREADEIIKYLRNEIAEFQTVLSNSKHSLIKNDLEEKNKLLEAQVENAKKELIRLEVANGRRQVSLPNNTAAASEVNVPNDKSETVMSSSEKDKPVTKKIKDAKPKRVKGSSGGNPDKDKPVDVSRLDLRVGRVLYVQKHLDANTLYIENIDVGELTSRTVVSGLVEHISMWDLKNRSVVVLCNLKHAKMRGIVSEAMVMCASSSSTVELLNPPEGSVPGDLIEVDGYPRNPDNVLSTRQSVFEDIVEELKTNSEGVATYKGSLWRVPGKGLVTAKTTGASIC